VNEPPALPPPTSGPAAAALVLLFLLHALPALVAVGGGWWAWRAMRLAARPGFDPLAAAMVRALPSWTALAALTGTAALGAARWLESPPPSPGAGAWWAWIAALALGGAGYALGARWFRDHPPLARAVVLAGFLLLGLAAVACAALSGPPASPILPADRTAAVRALHAVTGAVAAAALWPAWLAAGPAARRENGARGVLDWATAGLVLWLVGQLLVGLWLLGLLPIATGRALVGGRAAPTVALVASLALSLSAVRLAWRARARPDPRPALRATALHLLVVVLCMAVMRVSLR